jgi:hypothetical protein
MCLYDICLLESFFGGCVPKLNSIEIAYCSLIQIKLDITKFEQKSLADFVLAVSAGKH